MCPWCILSLILNLSGFTIWNQFICTGGASLGVNLALHLGASKAQLPGVVFPKCCKEELIGKLKPWCGSLSYDVQSSPWYLQGDVSESEFLSIATRRIPAGAFVSSPTEMGNVGSTSPGWVPKEHFMHIGSQQSPGLTKHAPKLVSSSFESLFPHGGEGKKNSLLKDKSFCNQRS